jgi:hypothetical protein
MERGYGPRGRVWEEFKEFKEFEERSQESESRSQEVLGRSVVILQGRSVLESDQ